MTINAGPGPGLIWIVLLEIPRLISQLIGIIVMSEMLLGWHQPDGSSPPFQGGQPPTPKRNPSFFLKIVCLISE